MGHGCGVDDASWRSTGRHWRCEPTTHPIQTVVGNRDSTFIVAVFYQLYSDAWNEEGVNDAKIDARERESRRQFRDWEQGVRFERWKDGDCEVRQKYARARAERTHTRARAHVHAYATLRLLVANDLAHNASRAYCCVFPCTDAYYADVHNCTGLHRAPFTRYVGPIDVAEGTFIGISLQEPSGKHDGELEGRRYFRSKPLHGVFCKPERCTWRGFKVSEVMK